MWIRLDTRRSANGEREGAPLPLNGPSAPIWVIEDRLAISAASAATVFALAIRRAALSRLVESARALGLDAGGRIYAGGAEQQYRPARWRLTKKPPRIAELESTMQPWDLLWKFQAREFKRQTHTECLLPRRTFGSL